MSTINPGPMYGVDVVAGEDLTGAQYRCMRQQNGYAFRASSNSAVWGILTDAAGIYERSQFISHGFVRVLLGESCTENQMLGPLSDGTLGGSSPQALVRATRAGQVGEVVWGFLSVAGTGISAAETSYENITVTGHGLTGPLNSPQPVMTDQLSGDFVLPGPDSLDTSLYQVSWMAESVVDANTLGAHPVALLESLGWRTFAGGTFNANSYYWLQNDGTTDDGVASTARLWYGNPSDTTKVAYSYKVFGESSGGGAGGIDTRNESRYSEYEASVDIASGTPVNMNAATAGVTIAIDVADNYTSHNARTAATFNNFYPRFLGAHAGGIAIDQNKISRNDGDPSGYIRFGEPVIAGSRILFRTSLEVVV